MKDFIALEKDLRDWEMQEFGTNDPNLVAEKIRQLQWEEINEKLTGMDEEQADWEASV